MRDVSRGLLSVWPPQRCFHTQGMTVWGVSATMGFANQYLVVCGRTRQGCLVDFFDDRNLPRWTQQLAELRVSLRAAIQTHHVTGTHHQVDALRILRKMSFASGVTFFAHTDETLFANVVDSPLRDGECVTVGELKFACLHTPGPSPGHAVFFEKNEGVAFTGDLITRGGRVMRPIPDAVAYQASLNRLVQDIPETTLLFPAHFGLTTMGAERRTNPYLMGLVGPALQVPMTYEAQEAPRRPSSPQRSRVKRWFT